MPFKNPHPLYNTWRSMRDRCMNPNFRQWADYGGRGITICAEWDDFHAFVRDMGPKPTPGYSLDRIDNDKGYSPENCRWATKKEQQRNRRVNQTVEIEGKTYLLAEVCEAANTKAETVRLRASRGMSLPEIIAGKRLPVRGRNLGPNGERNTHCSKGHEFTPENTYTTKEGWRNCRECHRQKVRRQTAAKRAAL